MLGYVHYTHFPVKPECAWSALPSSRATVHHTHMRRTYLREWRQHRNMKLVQVAEELHITHQQLGKIERGLQPYNQKLLEFLSDLYGCDESDLILRPPGAARDIRLVWDRIPEEDRDKALAVLEAFVKKTGTDN